MSKVDFSMNLVCCVTLIAGALFPIVLALIAKIPRLVGANASQFLWTFILITCGWLSGLFYLFQKDLLLARDFYESFFLYDSFLLIYLEIWALLSRGYTLGILLTFYKINRPLSADNLAQCYKDGEGLDWLIKHRFSGLISARLVTSLDDKMCLSLRGKWVAFLYQCATSVLGLRSTG